jgi:hypothetical protein
VTTPTAPNGSPAERHWQEALQPGPHCLPIERFGDVLTEAEEAHVAGCARCQTERDLFAAYETDEPVEGEGLAVEWIAAQTKRRLVAAQPGAAGPAVPAPATSPRTFWGLPSWALMAASVVVIVGGAALLLSPSRSIDAVPGDDDVYRTARIDITSAAGELAEAPAEIAWTAVAGAVQYEVRLSEVDGTELWRATTPSPAVPVPAEIRARALPAKTLIWQVSAKDAQGRTIAESSATGFRVRIPSRTPGR